jgi:gluconokinase
MIYVLFGPPGVGKTYIGGLLAKHKKWHFFDADTIYSNDDELRYLLESGKYDQTVRDRFVKKLIMTVQHMLSTNSSKDLVIAEAFTKEKNRSEFMKYFDSQIEYIMIHASRDIAFERMRKRMKKEDHVVDENVFEFVWAEFEAPKIPHKVLRNIDKSDVEIIEEFNNLIEY